MMDLVNNLSMGVSVAFTPVNLLFCLAGALVGTLIGVLPGLGPVATIAILLPVTFYLPTVGAIIMLAGIYYGAQYGGSTTAILVNIPGETSSLVRGMRFQYTGWIRAQKLVPASNLRVGTNDLLIIGGPETAASAIRAPQIQLKYLWDKTDYQLRP